MKLSIVVPAHNEEQRIPPFLDSYTEYFIGRYGDDMEFVIVVNGCSDETEGVVARYAEKYAQVRMLVEPEKIGKGGALMMGFREAKGDLVGFVDADGSTPPEAYQSLVDEIDDAGIVIASRWIKGSDVSPRQPLARRFASRVFNGLVRMFFGLRISDTQCGAKLMTRKALETVLPHLGVTRWAFDVDLLFQMRRAGFEILEVPTVWHDVAGSQLQVGRASKDMLLAICRLRLLYSPFRWVVGIYDRTLGKIVHLDVFGG